MSSGTKQAASKQRAGRKLAVGLIALAVLIALVYLFKQEGGRRSAPGMETGSGRAVPEPMPSEPVAGEVEKEASTPKAAFARLVGRWLREDGGYVIEIRGVEPDGKLRAAYFNPRPIHVSQAAAVEEGGSVKVGLELNDVNYPGCLYTLVFNAELDQLQGTYFQAAVGQTYQVAFIRMPVE
jgi:hypothetical protein